MPRGRVSEDEVLYRCVRRQYIEVVNGGAWLSSLAFSDPRFRPSVDRAMLRNSDPKQTQVDESDAVVSMIAVEVRGIGTVVQRSEKGNAVLRRAVDVEPVPLPNNPAHAEIYGTPEFATKGVFKKLSLALAQIARWEILPPDLR